MSLPSVETWQARERDGSPGRNSVAKARAFNEKEAQALIADRNYAALDQMVIEHLLGR